MLQLICGKDGFPSTGSGSATPPSLNPPLKRKETSHAHGSNRNTKRLDARGKGPNDRGPARVPDGVPPHPGIRQTGSTGRIRSRRSGHTDQLHRKLRSHRDHAVLREVAGRQTSLVPNPGLEIHRDRGPRQQHSHCASRSAQGQLGHSGRRSGVGGGSGVHGGRVTGRWKARCPNQAWKWLDSIRSIGAG